MYRDFMTIFSQTAVIQVPNTVSIAPGHFGQSLRVDTTKVPEVPSTLAIRTGEAIYNLRAGLDYLVGALSRLDEPDFIGERRNQFPVEHSPKKFRRRRKTWLAGVSDTHVASIEELQPYKGCDWTAKFAAASNMDKHNDLVRLQKNLHVQFVFDTQPSTDPTAPPIALGMKFNPSIQIVLGDGLPLIETLEAFESQVSETLDAFNPEFKV
jgi:hypothetical protein